MTSVRFKIVRPGCRARKLRGGSVYQRPRGPVTEASFFFVLSAPEPPARRLLCAAPSGGRERGSSPRRPRGRRSLVRGEADVMRSACDRLVASGPCSRGSGSLFWRARHASRFSREERKKYNKREVKRTKATKIELRT